jgi:predicted CXXCH cytochrome family protein
MKTSHRTALAVAVVVLVVSLYYGVGLSSSDKRAFMPDKVSYSHHQIELACNSCHGAAFADKADIEKRCHNCHTGELQTFEDAHGTRKFGDPRNAKWLQALDAKHCLSCHQEHVPEQTHEMLVSQPRDFCVACHADVGQDQPNHRGIDPQTCTNAGCHHYHDVRALNEDFVAAHLNEPDNRPVMRRMDRTKLVKKRLTPDRVADKPGDIAAQWAASSHANGHANCSDCHDKQSNSWTVDLAVCKNCHEEPFTQWGQGHHGMKFATMGKTTTVSDSALPMQEKAHDKSMNCNSCHQPHRYDTITAEAESCLGCHADKHSLAWKQSKHAELWRKDPNAGASCATCHMPRIWDKEKGNATVMHNISAMMRPQEKMLRPVCMSCHGYGFSLRALSDSVLIESNFSGKPAPSHQTLDWVAARKMSEKSSKGEKKQ